MAFCLTVIDFGSNWYAADVSRESLKSDHLGTLESRAGGKCGKAMLPTTRFGGHIVSGHVDAVGEITRVRLACAFNLF